jgi:hypothetical protein
MMYSETCLNKTSLEPTYVFRIVRSLVYTGSFHKDFLLWDSFKVWFIEDSGLFRVRFIQDSGFGLYSILVYSGLGLYSILFYSEFGLDRSHFT